MRAIRRARLFGILAFLLVGALSLSWYLSVTRARERYFIDRNHRLLTRAAAQIEGVINGQGRVFARLLPKDESGRRASAEDQIRMLRYAKVVEEPVRSDATGVSGIRERRIVAGVSGPELVHSYPSAADGSSGIPAGSERVVALPLDRLLSPILDAALSDHSFSSIGLATTDGLVIHAVGERGAELESIRLDGLQVPQRRFALLGNAQTASVASFQSVGRTVGVIDVLVAGTEFRLFTQPCCRTLSVDESGNGAPNRILPSGLVLVGLIEASEFRSHVREISPTLVLACVAAILLTLCAWPLFKLRLIGEQQRVRRWDVVAVVTCGACGVALLTTVLLDSYAYQSLRQVRDRQLIGLSASLSERAETQLKAAHTQLNCLTAIALDHALELRNNRALDAGERKVRVRVMEDKEIFCRASPFFSTFSLIDSQGMQQWKWSAQSWGPEPIDVSGRQYFQASFERARDWAWRAGRGENVTPGCEWESCTVESVWSWTTMAPEVVISTPTPDSELPVAALAIQLTALLDPVIPGEFEFAVIDRDGQVQFHSDVRRNTFENLFSESDRNPRLRAAVAGHSAETFSMYYAGRSYRAHASPFGVGGWSIVTMQGDEALWGVHTEWLVLWLAVFFAHMLMFTVLFALLLWRRDSTWLWWNPRRMTTYRRLAWGLTGMLAAAVLVAWRTEDEWLILAGFVITPSAWLLSYVVLRRPAGHAPSQPRLVGYTSTAVLLFGLTAIVPAAFFLVAAYHVQVRTYVKSVQLQLARDLGSHRARLEGALRRWPGLEQEASDSAQTESSQNVQFLFATTRDAISEDCDSGRDFGLLEWFVDEFVPYYSERSVQMRQLLHDRAGDDEWRWARNGSRLTLCLGEPNDPQRVVLASVAPNLLTAFSGNGQVPSNEPLVTAAIDRGSLAGLAIIGPIVLVGLTVGLVWFIKTRICLVDVEQPFWAKARLPGYAGENLFIVCGEEDRNRFTHGTHPLPLSQEAMY